MYLCLLPPFEGWDEYQHVAYIEHLCETGRAPVFGETDVPPRFLDAALTLPHPTRVAQTHLNGTGAQDYASYWKQNGRPAARASRHNIPLYEAQHGSLYYWLVAPVYAAFGGVNNLRASVAALRLVNLGLTAAAVAVVMAALRRAMLSERNAALVGIVLASHPLFLINGVRVANDALGVFLAAVAVALGLNAGHRRVFLWSIVLGVAAGLASRAKASNLALVPFAAVAWLVAARRQKLSFRRALLAATAMAFGFLAVSVTEFRFNLEHYGSLSAMQEGLLNRRNGRTAADFWRVAAAIPWIKVTIRLWTRELFFVGGWSFIRTRYSAIVLYHALTISLLGWIWRGISVARSRHARQGTGSALFVSAWVPVSCLVIAASYTLALGYHRVQSTLAWGYPTTGAWYACPALPWFLTLAAAGALYWPSMNTSRLRAILPLSIAAAGLIAEPLAVWSRMIPTYSGGATGREAFARLASLQPALLGTFTFFAAIVAEVVLLLALGWAWSRREQTMQVTTRRQADTVVGSWLDFPFEYGSRAYPFLQRSARHHGLFAPPNSGGVNSVAISAPSYAENESEPRPGS
jgi:4-amino-4-deoxy-L-arabinose transferase-like glycosyltransferase